MMTVPPETALAPDVAGGRVTVDLAALADNWRAMATAAPNAATGAVVKGDAYGLGLPAVVDTLAAAGCRVFFVALPEEGLAVRARHADADIYVLDGVVGDAAALMVAHRLKPVLNSVDDLEEWSRHIGGDGPPPAAALQVDTGMNRLGLTLDEARAVASEPDLVAALGIDLLISHLACADSPEDPKNAAQLASFRSIRALYPTIPASLANSGGVLLGPNYHFELVRPGIAIYGGRASRIRGPLKTVVTLEARILQIRQAAAGQTVGYGATRTLSRGARLAIVGIGYADGYHRLAGSSDARAGARAFVHGKDAPLVGRVSMDLIALDVSDIPEAQRGDWVEMFGPHVPVDEVAERAGTIGYELLTSVGRRCRRRYLPA